MTDTTQLPESNDKEELRETTEDDGGDGSENHRQDIFAALFHKLTDGFGAACEEQGIETAIAIAIHPNQERPVIFIRGGTLEAMSLMAGILRDYKEVLYDRLNTEPKRRETAPEYGRRY